MRGVSKPLLALAAILLLAFSLSACGGGDSEDSTATATTGEATATAPQQSPGGEDEAAGSAGDDSSGDAPSSSDSDSGSAPEPTGEGSSAFRTPGGDNSIQNFGEEPDSDEIEAANAVLASYLQARSVENWAAMCTDLAKATLAPLEDLAAKAAQFKGKGCAAILKGLLGASQSLSRTNTMTEGIASFRVEDDRGFALYHGPKGVDYFVPMVKEDGEWKVGSLAPSEFP
ncbi:MAG TPA: hypothetical protein VFX85_12170 [Solirubrobacterales bacterium]|nr:hypothetical protein [Solirubrobacterales bacterium]